MTSSGITVWLELARLDELRHAFYRRALEGDTDRSKPSLIMKLTRLIFADICRDGGSYVASFETDGGLTYNVFLKRSKMPDGEGLHHRWLFQHVGKERPEGCLPVPTESEEERVLLGLLRDFIASRTPEAASTTTSHEKEGADRLKEIMYYIERREPCFPSDLAGRRFS